MGMFRIYSGLRNYYNSSMPNLSVSLAQMHIQLGQSERNFERAANWIAEAGQQGSDLILFPELWSSGYDLSNWRRYPPQNDVILERLRRMAREHQIHIGGSLLAASGDRGRNRFSLIPPNPDAPIVQYDKLHLFRLMDEHNWLQPGERMQMAQIGEVKAGMAICYDLRFPEMFRRYALDGVQLALIPSEWPSRRRDHWRTLLRARAIENQMFVIAVNAVGPTGGEEFGGCSAVISPWGETLAECAAGEEQLLTIEIDTGEVQQVRRRIPILTDRRPDIYG